MKTNPSVRIFKFTGLAFLGIVMALVAQPSRAGAVNSLVITEDSNTSLTVTYNGRRVGRKVNPSPNLWQVYLTASSIRFSEMSVQWTESEDSHLVNFVFFGGGAA